MSEIYVTKTSMPDFNQYINEIKDLWDTGLITNNGAKHQKLEYELKKYLNTPNISLFVNGHLALETAIQVLQLSGEVITTPFTFASTTHAIVRNGLVPVFCDINVEDYTIDVDKIEELITEKTSAILPVHVYGNVCNITEIDKLANKYNLKVIYDAAHTFGVTVKGESIANFGDVSMFSFHATKVFNTIEGGALTYNDKKYSERFESIKNFGITSAESVDYVGTNAKMNELQAAMGLCNLKKVDDDIARRKEVFYRYNENLADIKGIKIPRIQENVVSNYAYYPILIDGYKLNRDEVYEKLKENNIFSRKYFYPLTNDFQCYKNKFNSNHTPIADFISNRILTLPLYPDLTKENVDYICKIIVN